MSRTYRYLSWPLTSQIPVYGNPKKTIEINQVKSINQGDSCNTRSFFLENHWGTHIDCPAHFIDGAAQVTDYPASFWIFDRPDIITIEAEAGMIIRKEDFPRPPDPDADFLIIKTGFGRFRGLNTYSCANPGIGAGVGTWLREDFPSVRLIGFDFISLSSFCHREEGRKSHRVFLSPDGPGHPVLILEDMKLEDCEGTPDQILVSPLRLTGLDGAPCTVIAGFS